MQPETRESQNDQMLDVFDATEVEIAIRADGRVVWLNIDGVARVRFLRPKSIVIDDRRH